MRISGTEPSSVILSHRVHVVLMLKTNVLKVSKQASANGMKI